MFHIGSNFRIYHNESSQIGVKCKCKCTEFFSFLPDVLISDQIEFKLSSTLLLVKYVYIIQNSYIYFNQSGGDMINIDKYIFKIKPFNN